MLVLGLDTCWSGCSAAICRIEADARRHVLAHRSETMRTGQAEALPQMLHEVLEQAAIGVSDLNRIIVPIGPGSFTGVRISVATARALALIAPVDLVACSSLTVIAAAFSDENDRLAKPLLVAMDARNEQAYVQVFEGDVFGTVNQPQLLSYEAASMLLRSADFTVAGTAAGAIAEIYSRRQNVIQVTILDANPIPDALDLCRAAVHLPVCDGRLKPMYLRPADAKLSSKPAIARVQHAE